MSNYAKYKDLGDEKNKEKQIENFNSNNKGKRPYTRPPQNPHPNPNPARQPHNEPHKEPHGHGHEHGHGDEHEVYQIKDANDKKNIILNNKVSVVYIWADWCQPCKSVAPKYKKLAKMYSNPGVCALVKENVELELTKELKLPDIRGIPHFQIFKNISKDGPELVTTITGGSDKEIKEIEDIIIQILSI